MLTWTPDSADWGNVAEWVAAIGASGALLFALAGWSDTRKVMREEFAERDALRMAEAQRVEFKVGKTTIAPDGLSFRADEWDVLTIVNGSSSAIRLTLDTKDLEHPRKLNISAVHLLAGRVHTVYLRTGDPQWSAAFADIRGHEWQADHVKPIPRSATERRPLWFVHWIGRSPSE